MNFYNIREELVYQDTTVTREPQIQVYEGDRIKEGKQELQKASGATFIDLEINSKYILGIKMNKVVFMPDVAYKIKTLTGSSSITIPQNGLTKLIISKDANNDLFEITFHYGNEEMIVSLTNRRGGVLRKKETSQIISPTQGNL